MIIQKNHDKNHPINHESNIPRIHFLNKIKLIASNIISNIKIRKQPSIRPFPIENVNHNIARNEYNEYNKKIYFSNKLDEYRLSVSILNKKTHEKQSSEYSHCHRKAMLTEDTDTDKNIYPYISSVSWKAPSIHGLDNSPRIIPDYYLSTCMNKETNILKIDYKYTILDDIRNLRKLSKYQIKYIKNMSSEDKQEIIEEYNRVIEFFLDALRPDEVVSASSPNATVLQTFSRTDPIAFGSSTLSQEN